MRVADAAHGEVIDLVRSIVDDEALLLEPLGGGRSGAHVFKATLASGPPVVVKISPRDEGMREKANYDRFVRPFLPVECRPDLLGFAEAHDHVALCYAFVDDGGKSETLTDRLAAGDLAALDVVLSSTFGNLRRCWYSLIQRETDLARYYRDRYFANPASLAEAEETLSGCLSRYFGGRRHKNGYAIDETVFPSIGDVLFSGRDERAYRSCILHGDLNSDNVVFGRDRMSAYLIDFQRTGRGHVYQDLVSIEASVRINYPPSRASRDILETERLIASDDPLARNDAYAAAICDVRNAAHLCFGHGGESSTYSFAVAAVGLRLMQATDLSDAARARISASALWAAKALMEG